MAIGKWYTGKWYYCKNCKTYPDKIIEHYRDVNEIREWTEGNDIYELVDTDHNDVETFCFYCNSVCVEMLDDEGNVKTEDTETEESKAEEVEL